MNMRLAFTRVWGFYRPSVRPWVRRNYMFVFAFAVGLFTGMYCRVDGQSVTYAALATFAALCMIRWWAFRSVQG